MMKTKTRAMLLLINEIDNIFISFYTNLFMIMRFFIYLYFY